MAKQNDTLEEILDLVDDISKKLASQQAEIKAIKEKVSETPQPKQENAKVTDVETKRLLRDALISALNHIKEKDNEMKITSLSEADYEKLVQLATVTYRTEFVKARKKLEADEKAEQERITEEYNVKREAQGFNTIEQVAEWASDYPYPIQRFMRYLGVSLFDEDEDPEKMKMCVKALGDFMLAASRCQKPPSLMNWLKYRWSMIIKCAKQKRLLTNFVFLNLSIIAIGCLCLYQHRVMQMDETNHIWYKTVIKTREDKRHWQEIDSILHGNGGFYDRLFK